MKLQKRELVDIAKKAIEKNWDFETLKYCDDLYGCEYLADEVWSIVEECKEIGVFNFHKKYLMETL